MKVFGDNLRQRALELGLSNAEVARRSGLAERRYANYVIGRREPDLATLLRISEVLGQSVDVLLRPHTAETRSSSHALRERIAAASAILGSAELQMVVVQVEALAIAKRSA